MGPSDHYVRLRCPLAVTLIGALLLFGTLGTFAQSKAAIPVTLKIIVDEKAPAHSPEDLRLILRSLNQPLSEQKVSVKTSGAVDVTLAPGRYQVTSEDAVAWGSQWAMWDLEVPVTERLNELRLNIQNAILFDHRPDEGSEHPRDAMARTTEPAPEGSTAPRPKIPKPSAQRPMRNPPNALPAPVATVPESGDLSNKAEDDDFRFLPPPVDLSSPATPLERAVVQVLKKWVAAVQRHDLDGLMSCYAPRMSRYFLQQNVSWEQVRRDKERFFARYPEVRKLEIRDVRIYPTATGAEVTLAKAWEFGGAGRSFSGDVFSRLLFEKKDDSWVISSEREREMWVRRVVDPDRVADQ